ncbi:MAG: CapA family protein [Candidatus Acidiferrales bacterium]
MRNRIRLFRAQTAAASLGAILLVVLSVAASPHRDAAVAQKPVVGHLRCSIADGFTLAAVGDVIIANPESANADPRFQAQLKILRSADVAFGNFEDTAIDIRHFRGSPQAENGGAWPVASPLVPGDLRKMGFSMMNRANNHSTDWGVRGMAETDCLLDKAGIVHAGTGDSMAAARAPQYLETPQGRVALVGMASTFTPMSVAADPAGIVPGRAGIDALRTTRWVLVTSDIMRSLVKLHNRLPSPSEGPISGTPRQLTVLGTHFELSDHAGTHYEMNQADLADILRSIRQGKESSDFLIATIHCHEPGQRLADPPDFLVKLAHEAIDNGADTFIGHGPHVLRGIEIYRGKPIFYSLGNYFFELHQQQVILPSVYDAFHFDPNSGTPAELESLRVSRLFARRRFWMSVIAVSTFRRGQVSEIRLYPVDLGFRRCWTHSGVPRLASPDAARSILERVAEESKPLGTQIQIEDNVGIIRVPPLE